MERRVYINWGISAFFGWGVYGLNLALQWARDPELRPIGARGVARDRLGVDPLRAAALEPFLQASEAFVQRIQPFAGQSATITGPVLHSLNGDFMPMKAAHDVQLVGQPNIGVTFFETTGIKPEALTRAASFPVVVTGSTWCERVLRAHGLTNVRTVLQGVEPSLFHPAPGSGALRDRFLVFSGGKLELRKGQDIVLAAFARFAARHPDALLVTAWHSPWPAFAKTVDQTGLVGPVPFTPNGAVDVRGWALANGVAANQVMDLGAVPNAAMPSVLREMDAAVFPNRSEGGTNLVAMEAMACGVPVILSANTGHLDLIDGDNCFALETQAEVGGVGVGIGDVPGWGDSDLDEVVEALERAYSDRDEARRRGLAGAESMRRLTWADTAAQMKDVILGAVKTGP